MPLLLQGTVHSILSPIVRKNHCALLKRRRLQSVKSQWLLHLVPILQIDELFEFILTWTRTAPIWETTKTQRFLDVSSSDCKRAGVRRSGVKSIAQRQDESRAGGKGIETESLTVPSPTIETSGRRISQKRWHRIER